MTTPIPPYTEMLWPVLKELLQLGGSAAIAELDDAVSRSSGWTADQLSVMHGDGPQTEIQYRLAWARTYLKGMGLITNSARGVWSVTEKGEFTPARDLPKLHNEMTALRRKSRRQRPSSSDQSELEGQEATGAWKEALLDSLLSLPPSGFERVAQRLLREAGFINATVTGRTGDGGIDGLGVYRLSLVSFPVFFQCKRYKGSVGAAAVRDFRGAMAGRGDKGLLITTGNFTADARSEATRDGAPPVDLIDGDRLCDLLKEHGLGVTTQVRQVEDVSVDISFFEFLASH